MYCRSVAGISRRFLRKEKPITGLNEVEDVVVFHAGTKAKRRRSFPDFRGPRPLGLLRAPVRLRRHVLARMRPMNRIRFAGIHYRKDIAAID